jgi:hypothetical protein
MILAVLGLLPILLSPATVVPSTASAPSGGVLLSRDSGGRLTYRISKARLFF